MVLKSLENHIGIIGKSRFPHSTILKDYWRWTLPVAPGDLSLCRETGCWSPGSAYKGRAGAGRSGGGSAPGDRQLIRARQVSHGDIARDRSQIAIVLPPRGD